MPGYLAVSERFEQQIGIGMLVDLITQVSDLVVSDEVGIERVVISGDEGNLRAMFPGSDQGKGVLVHFVTHVHLTDRDAVFHDGAVDRPGELHAKPARSLRIHWLKRPAETLDHGPFGNVDGEERRRNPPDGEDQCCRSNRHAPDSARQSLGYDTLEFRPPEPCAQADPVETIEKHGLSFVRRRTEERIVKESTFNPLR